MSIRPASIVIILFVTFIILEKGILQSSPAKTDNVSAEIVEHGALPHMSSDLNAFLSLPFTIEEETVLREFLTFLVGKNLNQIIENRDQIEIWFTQFNAINPLRLFGFVYSDLNMKQQMKILCREEIISDYVFLMLEMILKKTMDEDSFNQYIYGLEEFLSLKTGILMDFIDKEEYTQLFKFLAFEIDTYN